MHFATTVPQGSTIIAFPYDVRGTVGVGESGVGLDPGKCSPTWAGART